MIACFDSGSIKSSAQAKWAQVDDGQANRGASGAHSGGSNGSNSSGSGVGRLMISLGGGGALDAVMM